VVPIGHNVSVARQSLLLTDWLSEELAFAWLLGNTDRVLAYRSMIILQDLLQRLVKLVVEAHVQMDAPISDASAPG
jgi:hypothetical protein